MIGRALRHIVSPSVRRTFPASTLQAITQAIAAGEHRHGGQVMFAVEADLPVVVNEWCTTWGDPRHDKLLAIAERTVSEVDSLQRSLRAARRRPTVRLATDYAFSSLWLIPRMHAFRQQYPDIDLQIVATQRLAKLAKNVAAEASNFLMGRTFLDIDMQRAADLLGMDRRQAERIRDLVNLQLPGINLLPLPVAPRQIPFHAGSTYYELDRGSEHWQQLGNSGGFAFHIAGQFPGLNLAFWAIRG